MEAHASFEGPEDVVVLDSVALEETDLAALETHRTIHDQFVHRLGKDAVDLGIEIDRSARLPQLPHR